MLNKMFTLDLIDWANAVHRNLDLTFQTKAAARAQARGVQSADVRVELSVGQRETHIHPEDLQSGPQQHWQLPK